MGAVTSLPPADRSTDGRKTRALSSEENRREPDPREDQGPEASEPIEEAQGAPEDPGTVQDTEPEVSGIVEGEQAILAKELETARRERDEYLDALRRLKAEFENSRKRQERERARVLETASERLVVELLPVLDNLDRALEAGGDIHEGVRAIRDQLVAVLGQEGLLAVASDGQPFDPNVHEAVMGQPSEEHEEGTILQTFQRGYLLNGKPIRPAKVVVAK
jgi:molecular chaperone GrpE